ncbi:hypothetical protein [Marinobacter sp. 2_MG-2023]|uniref:hypothetical protein n=1 Tax=Marinobacter sp. 2_MG-2023 TaxID=3062679 RepID=UPI0026E441EB|nr:hypothetical protein [Marinobacter sp. 2_MG-2023]MDO6442238.1 hypothetical protein [Marinobacter sp. 2_MG-2023]
MEVEGPDHEALAKDFLRLSPEAMKAKYPEDEEVQGALAQIMLVRERLHTEEGASANYEMIETALMKRIALNLAQGLPVLVPDIDEHCREISAKN